MILHMLIPLFQFGFSSSFAVAIAAVFSIKTTRRKNRHDKVSSDTTTCSETRRLVRSSDAHHSVVFTWDVDYTHKIGIKGEEKKH